ncbi:MAG TPA: hypothetical protein DCS07_08100 [Bdellovibrionales bacterium]|nr:MAG: hypothetical protein A2Z97_08515 [Bdellovibrionales bacterium GWB1_52_6]OFZ02400.1 MAG: hypothetical protein A2X97_12685 [Bdellovibrionales bacterium GWA1_52_35]OFZ34331.1 MAG: hypothetical protein A2070_02920 [Bdellovibrionales bacterium GWC1_52_8]HAR42578.1 hypothetical protein [Bdellovibrionales bacterium]HCM41571.1 hypothetical protein [Bdellovibrionales bacterium]
MQISDTKGRTRAFARVIGPYITIVMPIIIVRLPAMQDTLSSFFGIGIIPWMTGGFLLMAGLIIIALHQYWSSAAAIMISLFGWFLAFRGAVLMAAPQLIQQGAERALPSMLAVQMGFGLMMVMGLYLTYVGWMAGSAKARRL